MKGFCRVVVILVVSLSLTGCAVKQGKITQTGFLSSYASLGKDSNLKGIFFYRDGESDLVNQYSKLYIEPVKFELSKEAEDQAVEPEEIEKLSTYFQNALSDKLKSKFALITAPEKGALVLRTAITGILPNKVYLNLHWSTTLLGAGIGGASLEAELIEFESDKRLFAVVDARKGKRLNYTKGLTKWGHTKEVLDLWARYISEKLGILDDENVS